MRFVISTFVCVLWCAACGTATPPSRPADPAPAPADPLAVVDAMPAALSIDAAAGSPDAAATAVVDGLARVRELIAKNDHYAAHLELSTMVANPTSVTVTQEADLLLIQTLARLKLPSVALAHGQRVLQSKQLHRHRTLVVRELVELSRVLPYVGAALPRNLNVNHPELAPVRDELLVLLAQRALREGRFTSAIAHASRVAAGSTQLAPAKMVHWEALWRTRKLTAAAGVLQGGFMKGSPFEARAHLELARMLWRSKDIPRARRLFGRSIQVAKPGSPELAIATFERALLRLHQRGKLTPFKQLDPTSLRHLVYAQFCARGPGSDAFAGYRGNLVRSELQQLLAAHADNAMLYRVARQGFPKLSTLGKLARTLARLAIADPSVQRTFDQRAALEAQLALVRKADGAWQSSTAGAEVLQELTLQASLAEADAGRAVRTRITGLLSNLSALTAAIGRTGARIAIGTRSGTGFALIAAACPK